MELKKDYKCKYCNNITGLGREDSINYDIIIPDEIVPRDGLELIFANHYKYGHHNFCSWKCYNLKVLDDAINHLSYSLEFPEDNFLPGNLDRDISNAKDTLKKLNDFKKNLLKQ